MQQITTRKQLNTLGSAYTITGAGGDLTQWTAGYKELLVAEGIVTDEVELKWSTWTGAAINRLLGLTGDNRYQDDLVFLAFDPGCLGPHTMQKLAMFKIRHQDRWLDDIISNDLRKKEEGCLFHSELDNISLSLHNT